MTNEELNALWQAVHVGGDLIIQGGNRDWAIIEIDEYAGDRAIAQAIPHEEYANFMAASFKAVPMLLAEIKRLTDEKRDAELSLGRAAMEINVAGPVDHRIRMMKEMYQSEIEKLNAEVERLKGVLAEINDLTITPWIIKDIIHRKMDGDK